MTVPIASIQEAQKIRLERPAGIVQIKPRVILKMVEEHIGRPVSMRLSIPSSEIGSVTMLEASLLVAMIKLTQPSVVLEFGTFMGYSTRIFAENVKQSTRVVSVDLESSAEGLLEDELLSQVMVDGSVNDKYLISQQAVSGTPYLQALCASAASVELLKTDSKTLSLEAQNLQRTSSLVFVDGGHDFETATSDSLKALESAKPSGLVVWHDFGSELHPDVSRAVETVAAEYPVYSIASTMLAILPLGGKLASLHGGLS